MIENGLGGASRLGGTAVQAGLPTEAKRHLPQDEPTLLGTAAGDGGFNTLFGMGSLGAAKGLSKVPMAGKLLGVGLVSGVTSAPLTYAAEKTYNKYKDDKKFDFRHMGAITGTSLAAGTIGTGAMFNASNHLGKLHEHGVMQTTKNILNPVNVLKETKTQFAPLLGAGAKGGASTGFLKGKGGALMAAGMLGMSLINPISYYRDTKKREREAMRNNGLKKTAAINKETLVGAAITGVGGYYTAKYWLDKQRKAFLFNKKLLTGEANG